MLTSASKATPRRPTTRSGHDGETPLREAILDAARNLYLESGPANLSARRIAAVAGCSATAIYRYYASMGAVLHALRMEGHHLLAEYLRRPSNDQHVIERLAGMQREYYCFARENPDYFRLMFPTRIDEFPPSADGGAKLYLEETLALNVVVDAVRTGVERGELPTGTDPVLVANLGWMTIHGLASMVVSGHAGVTAPERSEQLLEAVILATGAALTQAHTSRPPQEA